MTPVCWQYSRKGIDAPYKEPSGKWSKVHLFDNWDAGGYALCGLMPNMNSVMPAEIVTGEDAYHFADPCKRCHDC